jgi:hypothetical protein
MSTYAIADGPAPLYNTPDFPHHQQTLKTDYQGLLKEVEVVVFPNTKFTIQRDLPNNVCEVMTNDYPSLAPLYIDSRFLKPASFDTPEREKKLPPPEVILNFMRSALGARYFWGGNWIEGISKMTSLYPQLSPSDDLICKGTDCSGLLYQATGGYTPRNTSDLLKFGEDLGLNPYDAASAQKIVKPLDMIVWNGHVIFVLDSEHIIESVLGQGVIISDFVERYTFFQDKNFSVRRWHPNFLT